MAIHKKKRIQNLEAEKHRENETQTSEILCRNTKEKYKFIQ